MITTQFHIIDLTLSTLYNATYNVLYRKLIVYKPGPHAANSFGYGNFPGKCSGNIFWKLSAESYNVNKTQLLKLFSNPISTRKKNIIVTVVQVLVVVCYYRHSERVAKWLERWTLMCAKPARVLLWYRVRPTSGGI